MINTKKNGCDLFMKKYLFSIAFAFIMVLLSNNSIYSEETWDTLNSKMIEFYNNKNYEEGFEVALKCVKAAEKDYGKYHLKTATSLNNLAEFYKLKGDLKEAEKYYKQSLAIGKVILGKNSYFMATCYKNLGFLYDMKGELTKAEKYFIDSVEITKKANKGNRFLLFDALNNLLDFYTKHSMEEKRKEISIRLDNLVSE